MCSRFDSCTLNTLALGTGTLLVRQSSLMVCVNYSVMQVFVSSQGARATVSLPDLSMFFVFLFFGFPAGILDWLGDRHI